MNKVFYLFMLVFMIQFTSCNKEANGDVKIIEDLAKGMFVSIINKDYDYFIDTAHPKILENTSKEAYKNKMKSVFEGDKYFTKELFYKGIPKYSLSSIFEGKKNNLKYAFLSYNASMKLTFHRKVFETESMKKQVIKTAKEEGMEATFISDNTIDVLKRNRVLVIMNSNETNNKWVGVNYEPGKYFSNILPTELLKKTMEYLQDLNKNVN